MSRQSPTRIVAATACLVGVIGVIVGIGGLGLGSSPAAAATSVPSASRADRQVIVAVLGDDILTTLTSTAHKSDEPRDRVLRQLTRHGFSIGLASTDLGSYDRRQALLDISQGTRQQRSLYGNAKPTVTLPASSGPTCIGGWSDLVANAHHASVTLEPGLLAATIPGGAAFVGVAGDDPIASSASIVAADRAGCIADVTFGRATDVAQRTQAAAVDHRLVVVGLPAGPTGWTAADDLAASRRPGQLLVVAELPPTVAESRLRSPLPSRFFNQTAMGVIGLGGSATGRLASPTTRQPGLVGSIDIAPTALRFLGIDVPDRMRGQVITSGGRGDPTSLENLRRRWADVRNNRQLTSYRMVFLAALLVFVGAATAIGVGRALRPALRIFGLAVLWWPAVALAMGLVSPRSGDLEILAIGAGSVVLAALVDRVLLWPRAPLVPAVVLLVGLTIDLANGGHVLTRSVLGPSVTSGSRFYGISNEFEPLLPVVALAGLAAVTTWRRWEARPTAWLYGVVGAALAVVVGWGRLGADVGGVVTVGAGFAGALVFGTGRLTRAKLLLLLATPVAALAGLVGLDLVSHGGDHLSNNLTRSGGGTDLWELVARRYQLAGHVLANGGMTIRLAIALLAVALVARNREQLLGSDVSAAWRAALFGGLAAGAAGALANDSGPVLFVNAVFTLVGVVAYLRGRPEIAVLGTSDDGSPGTSQRWDTVGSRG